MNNPAAAPAGLDSFFETLRTRNPFTANRATDAGDDVDVSDLQQSAFQRLTALAQESFVTRRGLGAVLWGEPGVGKSHLLARLSGWAAGVGQAHFLALHNLLASPVTLPRRVLQAVVSTLSECEAGKLYRTLLFRSIRDALKAGTQPGAAFLTWPDIRQTLTRLLLPPRSSRGEASLADPTVPDVLFQFYRSTQRWLQRKEDGSLAALALRWLRGEALEVADGKKLGLPPPRRRDDPVALEDNQQIKQVLVALTRLAWANARPFVLCFDQIETFDDDQITALSRFLEALLDSSPNLLVVTCGVRQKLMNWRDREVIQPSSWDRLAQFEVALTALNPQQARQLIASRLQRFLAPYQEIPQLRPLLWDDPLFPLGTAWSVGALHGREEVRPREILNAAREAWAREQQRFAEVGAAAWLGGWKEGHGSPASAPAADSSTFQHIQQAIDEAVQERLTEHQARQLARGPVFVDRVGLQELLQQLLEECGAEGGRYGLARIERLHAERGAVPPTYDLIAYHGDDRRTGVLSYPNMSPEVMAQVLRRLTEDPTPPERILLVTDEEGPSLETAGERYLAWLKQRPSCLFEVVQLLPLDFVRLEALQEVRNQARSEDFEVTLPDGQKYRVSEEEVMGSHHRQGRYAEAVVLGEVLSPVLVPPGPTPTMDLAGEHPALPREITEDTVPL